MRKRKDGNSYVVTTADGNTYIRGRRLLKPISSANTFSEPTASTSTPSSDINNSSDQKTESSKKKKEEMPRRSPRNHVSTRAADIEIAARITAIYIGDIEYGGKLILSLIHI